MALISVVDAPPLALCAAGAAVLPVKGMTATDLLMSVFHLPSWLNLANAYRDRTVRAVRRPRRGTIG